MLLLILLWLLRASPGEAGEGGSFRERGAGETLGTREQEWGGSLGVRPADQEEPRQARWGEVQGSAALTCIPEGSS